MSFVVDEHPLDTRVALREYFDARLAGLALATDLASRHIEKQLDMARELFDREHAKVLRDVAELREFRSAVDAKASQGAVWVSTALGIAGLVTAVLSFALRFVR